MNADRKWRRRRPIRGDSMWCDVKRVCICEKYYGRGSWALYGVQFQIVRIIRRIIIILISNMYKTE